MCSRRFTVVTYFSCISCVGLFYLTREILTCPFYDRSWGRIFTARRELAFVVSFTSRGIVQVGKIECFSWLGVNVKASEFGQNDKLLRLENDMIFTPTCDFALTFELKAFRVPRSSDAKHEKCVCNT